ncbi:MAG: DNA polymerase Y family protein [Nannocystis sp.]|uniref:Y-family DNA polymerase n=1 Tax=Nannocystis sp. TaxID=1962667 RepID=UPI002425A29F|nr:DNA polymerase Y family protein [Nannocystis sp.]MBK9754897.1 DNA polymerase Y family protein [Nannocystis sp.]
MVERVACVDLPALPLQWLLRARPAWRAGPVAVLARGDLQGEVLHCNTAARRCGVTPGMRHGAALAVAPGLQAEVVPAEALQAAGEELLALLLRRAPRVEPGGSPGVFWIDPSGLERLFGELGRWSEGLLAELQAAGFTAGLVIGFHRHRAHALARMVRGARVLASPEAEASLLGQVPLARVDLPPGLLDSLAQLGIHHLAGFLGLPAAELRARFGLAAALVQARYLEAAPPLRPTLPREPVTEGFEQEPPDDHCERLLFAMRPKIDRLLQRLAAEGEALTVLEVELELDHAPPLRTRIEPAAPVGPNEAGGLVELLHLRLAGTELAAPVLRVRLTAIGARVRAEQGALLGGARRDLQAAGRALARVRAAFGEQAVTRARLRPAHLPEAGFRWEPIAEISCPKVQELPANHHEALAAPPLCRRLLPRPRPLTAWTGRDDGDWLARTGLVRGAVIRMDGPHRVSGGWWARTVERDYYYAETSAGDIAWVYHDRARARWFLHGLLD